MKGKHLLLTGATGGIGKALATQLASQGATLWLTGRDAEKLEQLVNGLPGRHHTIAADLNREVDRYHILSTLQSHNIRLDVLVHAAGTNSFAWLGQTNDADIARLVQCNLLAPLLLTRLLLLNLNPNGAQIINIGSTFGSIGYPGYSTYCASKFGLRGFSQALSRELADTNTVVQYIAPRATRTAMNQGAAVRLNEHLGNAMDTPEAVAQKILRAIKRKSGVVTLGWPERLFVALNQLASPLVSYAIQRQLPVIKRFAREV